MRIKTKLALGLSFLFGITVVVGTMSAFYLTQLSADARDILKNNYESIDYAQKMTNAVERNDVESFDKFLVLQEKNITEPGERETTADLRKSLELFRQGNQAALRSIRMSLSSIINVNMQALERKNSVAQSTAHDALIYIGIIGSLCFIITFTFIINFPGYIANPITELTEGIREIANKNYDERLHFKSGDEFGELAEAFNSMAQKLDVYENSNLAQILFEKKRIDTIINKMNDPIVGLDEKKNILFVNNEALRIIGKSSEDLIGKYAPDVAMGNDLLRTLIRDIMEDHVYSAEPVVLKIFADGKESYFSKEILRVTIVPTGEKKTISVGFVIILKNVTSFKELDLAKTNFIATVSHELKTPLASIQMCSQLLSDARIGTLNEEQTKIIKTVQEETDRLIKITGELLDLAQVETGKLELQLQSVKPGQIIDYAVSAMKFQAEQKQIQFEVHCSEDLPLVKADLEKTSWVMVNFLTNAIHYSAAHSSVVIHAQRKGNQIIFSVRDFGKGIDPSFLPHLFEKFYKVPGSRSGTGLGLAISSDFIISQNGKIWAESDPGVGSTFSFSLDSLPYDTGLSG